MLELLGAGWDLVSGLLLSVWGVLVLVGTFSSDVLVHLHTEMPRVEGLLVGVLLTWFLARREKHALLRVVSAPLKLVLDILDLVWDQCLEVIGDLKGTVVGWLQKGWGLLTAWPKKGWTLLVGALQGLKDKLSKSAE